MAYCKTILNVINADLEVLSLRHLIVYKPLFIMISEEINRPKSNLYTVLYTV